MLSVDKVPSLLQGSIRIDRPRAISLNHTFSQSISVSSEYYIHIRLSPSPEFREGIACVSGLFPHVVFRVITKHSINNRRLTRAIPLSRTLIRPCCHAYCLRIGHFALIPSKVSCSNSKFIFSSWKTIHLQHIIPVVLCLCREVFFTIAIQSD